MGLIPYGMYMFEGYDSFVTTYGHKDLPNLDAVHGLRVEEVPVITGDWVEDSCTWLKHNARRIDVLNIYHLIPRSLRHALTYKLHNPKGKIYLKFDGVTRGARFRLWKNIKPMITLMLSRLASTEFQENVEFLSRTWHKRIICVPNPVSPNEARDYRPFSERSDIIMYCGRIEIEKGSYTLLDAFAKINEQIPNWSLRLVGSITEQNLADKFKAEHPELMKRIIFTGEITDRDEMTELYRDAKIFAFPSRWEGCSIALAEALHHGLFAVTSNIQPNEFLTKHFAFALGSDVDDVDGLAKNLLYACTHESEIEALAREGRTYALERCDLERVCNIIADGLK